MSMSKDAHEHDESSMMFASPNINKRYEDELEINIDKVGISLNRLRESVKYYDKSPDKLMLPDANTISRRFTSNS